MEGMNKVLLLGNLGADPELRVTGGGQAILKLRMATTETFLDRNNVRQERTEWHSIAIWGKRGEALAKILHKGERIFIEGAIRTSSYEKDGEKRYRTEITATNVILMGTKKEGETTSRPAPANGASTPAKTDAPPSSDPSDYGDYSGPADDIPF